MQKNTTHQIVGGIFFRYMFIQLVAPSAVTMAVATDAMICTINLMVSFLVIVFSSVKIKL